MQYALLLIYFDLYVRVPVSPLMPYSIKFVQRGFIDRAAFEKHIPLDCRLFAVDAKIVDKFLIFMDLGGVQCSLTFVNFNRL